MCGIAGFFGRDVSCDNWYEEICGMIQRIAHRGPDDTGVVGVDLNNGTAENVATNVIRRYDGMMGFCRLSIRDLSMNGHQPMVSDDKKVIICFNGELYNADYYRQVLITKGYKFRGNSDTEVILNLYQEYGIEEMAPKLNGMFGIVICDIRQKQIWLLRDRVGIKPLYYGVIHNRLVFASEVKAFLALKDFERRVNMRSFMEVLTFCRPANDILLEGIEIVKPGQIIGFHLDGFQKREYTYFDINQYERPKDTEYSMKQQEENVMQRLLECTDNQKASDVKVGCQLSGGIDSSLISYAANVYGENRLNDSVSVVFDEQKEIFSEEKYINTVVEKLDLDAHNEPMTCDYFLKNYEKVIWHSDTVIGRPNSVGLFLISETARKHVTVLLSGEGADELLGGYDMFRAGHHVTELLEHGNCRDGILVEVTARQKELIHNFSEFAVMAQQKTPDELCKKVLPGYEGDAIMKEKIAFFDTLTGSNFDRQTKYALSSYLQSLLIAQDKMSMANSIENRVPILDNDFIELAFSIPETMLMREVEGKIQGKYILKKLCANIFGEEFAYRKKMGFPFPFFNYMKDIRFKEYFYDLLLPGMRKRGIVDVDEVKRFYEELHWSNPFTVREMFWKVCGFESWCQMFIDGRECYDLSEWG